MSTSCAFINEKGFKDFFKLPEYKKETSFCLTSCVGEKKKLTDGNI